MKFGASLFGLFVGLAGSVLFAQTGGFTGQVTDATGAAVPGAAVTVKNLGTGIAKTVTTGEQGYYTAPLLNPGSYEVSVAASGFKSVTRSNIPLEIAQIARIDFALEVGEVREQVTVTSEAPLLQTERASLAQLIGEKPIRDLPLNGRMWTQLALLTPGALDGGAASTIQGSEVYTDTHNVEINGLRNSMTAYVMDGVNTTQETFSGTSLMPPPDAIQEFKVLSNSLPAEYGLGAAVITMELKSGTNQFHGSAYEFMRNDKLDARNFFAAGKAPLRQNQFGGMAGGRIIRNRTFFFVDYEATRVRRGQTTTDVVPTAAMRQGDFSGVKAIIDPTNGAPFAGARIPADRLSSQAAYFLPYLPLPNTPAGTYVWSASGISDINQVDARVDHLIRSGDSLKVSYSFHQRHLYSPGSLPANGASFGDLRVQRAGLTELHSFSPSTINEFRAGYYRTASLTVPQGLGTNHTVASGIGGLAQTSAEFPGFPGLSISGYTGFNANNWNPLGFREPHFELSDSVSLIRGTHSLKAGFYLGSESLDDFNSGYGRGGFTFSGTYTGQSYADFLLGVPYSAVRGFPRDSWGFTTRWQHAFIQDDWKISRRVTLNFGVRYELNHPQTFLNNQLSFVDFPRRRIIMASDSQGNVNATGQQVTKYVLPAFTDLIVPGSKSGLPNETLRYVDPRGFAPRLGLAMQVRSGFVVRAGYGIQYGWEQGNSIGSTGTQSPPFAGDQLSNFNTTPIPSLNLSNFFKPITAVPGGYQLSPLSFYYLEPQRANQYIQQWNVAVQKSLATLATLEVAYVGNKATKMPFSQPLNVPLPGPGVIQDRRAWPLLGAGSYLDNSANYNYNALQSKVEVKLWRGLSLLTTYTFQKAIDMVSGDPQGTSVQDPNNPRAERGRSGFDVTHQLNISSLYALPFLRARHDLLGRALGGWSVSNIITLHSGLPFTPSIGTDPANTGRSLRPNRIGSGVLSNPTVYDWFDISAFQVPALYTYGNSSRDILNGPRLARWDLGLLKDFPLSTVHEQRVLQFRGEFFTFTNTPTFGLPVTNIQAATAGRILSSGDPREIQFGLKLMF